MSAFGTISDGDDWDDTTGWNNLPNLKPYTVVSRASGADYYADGSDDDVQIQAANDAFASGGTIYVAEGTYEIGTMVSLSASTRLIGAGSASILKLKNATGLTAIVRANGANVEAAYFQIDGNKGSDPGNTNGFFCESTAHTYVRAHDLYIKNMKRDAIAFYNAGVKSQVYNNMIETPTGQSIILAGTCNDSIITNNTCISNGAGGQISADTSGYNIIISNNNVYNTGGHGIELADGVVRVTIAGNIIDTVQTRGILIGGTGPNADCTVSGNTVRNCGAEGIWLADAHSCVVDGNIVVFNAYAGIELTGDSYSNVITNNLVKNNLTGSAGTYGGIDLYGAATENVSNNIITGNRCFDDQGTQTQDYGIVERGTTTGNNVIRSNILNTNKTGSIVIVDPNTTVDYAIRTASLDLSGAATDLVVWHADHPCELVGYWLFYTEVSTVDAGVTVEVGRYQDGVALDDDYFDQVTSEVSKALGYSKSYVTADLTNTTIAAGDTVTVGTAGGKADTGEIAYILKIATTM